jgi:serine/threonine protein kinase
MMSIATQLFQTLDAAHVHGVVHRDMKPDNIILVPSGRAGEQVKLLDFGISQKADEIRAQLTIEGSVLGTPHYMSPEQAMGEPDVDGRADVYGAAVCLYEAVVGDVPFDAPNYNKLLRVILNEQPVPPRERGATIDAHVEGVIMMALHKEREKRPQSAGEMLELLLAAAAGDHTLPFDRDQISFGSGRPGVDRTVPSSPAFQYREAPGGRSASSDGLVIDFQPPSPKKPSSQNVEVAAASAAPPSSPGQGLDLPASRVSRPMPALAAPAAPSVRPVAPASPSVRPPVEDDDYDPLSMDLHGGGNLELDEVALASSQRPRATSNRGMSMSPPTVTPAGGTPTTTQATRASGQFRASMPPERSSVAGTMAAPPGEPKPAEPDRSGLKKIAWYVLGGLILFVAAVFAVRFAVHGVEDDVVIAPNVPDDPEVAPPDPVAPGYVTIDITGLPPGAQIRLDGLPAATLPMRLRQGTGRHVIEVSAPGYGERRIEIVPDRNRTVPAGLRPMEGMGTRIGP